MSDTTDKKNLSGAQKRKLWKAKLAESKKDEQTKDGDHQQHHHEEPMDDKPHQKAEDPLAMLDLLPQRARTLDQHIMVTDLSEELLAKLRQYLLDSFPGSPEVSAALLDHVAVKNPKHLRVKELFETVESVKRVGSYLVNILTEKKQKHKKKMAAAKANGVEVEELPKNGGIPAIYDIACGHGLGGILLAYRFANIEVVCCDRKKRPAFDSFLDAFAEHEVKEADGRGIRDNIRFVEGDVGYGEVGNGSETIPQGSFIVCVHGCNEVATMAMSLAKHAKGAYGVLPCCVRDGVFGVKTGWSKGGHSQHDWHLDDASRYAIQVGALAGSVGAHKVCCIDNRITNRHLVILGNNEGDEDKK